MSRQHDRNRQLGVFSSRNKAGSKKRHSKKSNARFGQLESLESRIVLDVGAIPAISGTVYRDLNTDGLISPGEAVPNVSVRLILDDGDGLLELGQDDQQVDAQLTDAQGFYCFGDLNFSSRYFIYRPAQTVNGVSLEAYASAAIEPGQASLAIDRFQTRQLVIAEPPFPSADNSTLVVSASDEVIGQERDMAVELTQGSVDFQLRVNPFGLEQVLVFDSSAGTQGTRVVTWDGQDGDGDSLAMRLGGIDLTQNNQNTGIMMRAGTDHEGADVRIRYYTGNATTFSEASVPVPVTGGEATGFIYIPFADFTGTADASSVDAIQMFIETGEESANGKIDVIGAIGARVVNIGDTATADLFITKGNGVDTVVPGEAITYVVVARNAGPNDVVGARITDPVANFLQNVTYTSVASGGATGNTSGSGAISNIVNMPVNSAITYTIQGIVRDDAAGTLVNTAQIVPPAGVLDTNLTNNSSTDRDPIGRPIDLRITKDDGVRTVRPGQQLTYTIVATNFGPGPVVGASVTDAFPDNLVNVSYTSSASVGATGNTVQGTGDINDTVTLPEGGRITYTVSATVAEDAFGTVVNRAVIAVPNGYIDTRPENNIEIDTDLVRLDASDLSIIKTNNQTVTVPGETISYSIIVTNAGPGNASNVRVIDELPASLLDATFTSQVISGTVTGQTNSGSGSLDETLTMLTGSQIEYTVTGTVSSAATGVIANTATVSFPGEDPNLDNNEDSDNDVLTPRADLSVTKTDGVETVAPGSQVTYTIVVANAGPSDAPGARFSDSIPAILTNVSYTREANGVITDGTGNTINDVLNIGAGEQVTYTVTGSLAPSAAGQLTNMATVTPPTNVLDPQPFNNSDIDTDNISRETIDLSIVKRSGLVEAIPGRPIRYQIVVSNIGNTDVSGAVVRDLFPDELNNVTWQSLATDGASGNSPSGSGAIEETVNLQVGSSIIYTVVGTIDSSATNLLNNIATVTAEGDTSPGNNTSIDTVFLVPTADLSITKTDGVDEVAIGDSLTYTIVATNHGPSNLTGVSVSDVLPDSLTNSTFTSVASGGASGNSASGTGNLNETLNLPVGSSVTYTVTATAGFNIRGMLTNTAVIQAPAGAVEIDPDNNVAIDTDRLKDVVRLGSEPTVIRRDSIVSETDSDVFQITAHDTGKLIINSLFDHEFGDLDIEVADSRGNVIAVANSTTDHENLVIPVVSQEQYFIRVFGKDGATNIYNLEVENFPTPRPAIVRLDAPSDSGMMNDDAITNETNPRFLITTDLSGFTSMGIPFLQPADGESALPNQAGVAIEVQLVNTDTGEVIRGFARQLGQNNSLYEFTAVDSDATLDGNYLIQAFVRVFDGRQNADGADPASGRGPLSDPSWFIVDTIAPTAADRPDLVTSSDSGMSNEDNVTHINQPALTGVGEPGVKVRIFANRDGVGLAELIGQGVTNSDGLWEITVEPLADGKHHVRAIYEDMAGNISTLGEPLVLTIDTTPPNTPYLDLLRSSDTGMGDTDNITNDSTPTFSMTTHDTENGVDFDYKFRVYLRADAESAGVTAQEVLLYDSAVDPLIPVAELLDGLTNNELLTRTFGELPDGTHNLKLEVEDRAGNISEDFLLTVTIDTQAPPAELDLIDSSDSGILNDDNVTKNPAPTFSGVSELNSMVTLFANGVPVGTGMVGSDESNGVLGDGLGAWHVTTQNLVDGQYEVVAQITDKAGNSTTSAAETIWVDTVKPNIPLLDLITDTGHSGTDNITSDTTPTVTVTAGATTDGEVNEFPNDIKYRIYDRPGNGLGEVLLIDSYGALQDFTTEGFFTEILPELSEGVHNLKVEIEDRAGNISDAFLLSIEIDSTVGVDLTLDLLDSSDTGMFDTDNVTSLSEPAFGGVGTVGDEVYLFANGTLIGSTIVGTDETDGVPGNGLGAWQITSKPLDDGEYEIVAHLEDWAGNFTKSDPMTIWVDTTEPNQPFLSVAEDTGMMDDDGVTNVNPPTFTIIANDTTDGGANAFPHDVKIRLYDRPGNADGETLIFSQDLTEAGSLTITLPEGLAEGIHNLKLEVEDRAGNISHPYLTTIRIDTTPPAQTPIDLLTSSDSGMMNDDNVTNKMQPAFSGVSSVGSKVFIFANGQIVGEGVVGTDETDGIPGNGLGAWEVTVEPLVDGEYEVFAHVEDLAGNFVQSDTINVTIDTAVPNTPLLDLISDTGINTTDNITSDNTPTVSVTANDTVEGGDNPAPHDIKYRLYDRDGLGNEILLVDSFAELNDFTTGGIFTFDLPELADGVHNLKLEVEDRAGNISPDFLLQIIIDTGSSVDVDLDMLDSSDTGMSSVDNVTSMESPAFTGTGTVGDTVYLYANGSLVGTATVGSDETDGVPGDGRGAWEITSEPLDDDVYEIVAHLEDSSGNFVRTEPLTIEVDTLQPNTPFLNLLEADDAGRHNDDNITNADTVAFSATTSDLNDALHQVLFPGGQNLKFRIYVRPESGNEVLIYDSTTDASLPDLIDGLTSQTQIITGGIALPEGLHNLKLEVEDRAGNISEDFLSPILIDRTPGTCTAFLHPDSDTGVEDDPSTFTDGITSDATPSFYGTAEANSIVTIMIDGIPVGTAVALPTDGDDAFQPPNAPNVLTGNWRIDTNVFLTDGMHTVQITCEDPAGNRITEDLMFNLEDPRPLIIDTDGPKIENITRDDETFTSLFTPKPDSGPDPLIHSIVIHLSDGPLRTDDATFGTVVQAMAEEEGNYILIGDANGHIPIVDVQYTLVDDGPGLARSMVKLVFGEPLPDDRFTLTVSETITDLAGNFLDGESGARAPFTGNNGLVATPPIFPTGDDAPGGDFVARFTVDSRPEVGTWGAGNVWIDTNGNETFDPENLDYVNRDIVYRLGFTSDDVFAGNFALGANDTTDGYDKLAAYGRFGDTFRFLVDTDNDGVPNIDSVNPHANGLPVAGRFDNNDANGDEVAIFDGRNWYIDTDHDFKTDYTLRSFLVGYPIVGDFDGDGFDDLATWTDDTFRIDLANGVRRGWDGKQDVALWFGYIGVRERPVAADMDQDGFDDLGLWVPDREGVTDRDQSEWYFLVSNGNSLLDRLSPPDDPIDEKPTIDFTPVPFGPDMYIRFGDEFALPIVGNFDPPTLPSTTNSSLPKNYTNSVRPMDVNNDSLVTAIDALLVINELNGLGARELTDERSDLSMIDVNDDGYVSPIDALVVLNHLNSLSLGEAEGVVDELPEGEFDHRSVVFDQVFANRTASRSSDSASLGILPEVELQTIAAATSSRWEAPAVEVASVFAADGWNKLPGQRKSVSLDDAFEDEENWLV